MQWPIMVQGRRVDEQEVTWPSGWNTGHFFCWSRRAGAAMDREMKSRRRPATKFLVRCGLFLFVTGKAGPDAAAANPNILFILADSSRKSHNPPPRN